MTVYDSNASLTLAQRVIKDYEKMKAERVNWDSYWEDLAEYFLPQKDNVYGFRLEGEEKYNRLYDSTSVHSLDMMASFLHGMLTNPASVWFGLSTGNSALDMLPAVNRYLQECTRIMIETFNQSNFQEEIHETYLDLGGIGTTVLEMEEDEKFDIRFRSRSIYSSYVRENAQGIVDTLARSTDMTLRQIRQKYGMEVFIKHPDLHQRLLDNQDAKEAIIYRVMPSEKLKGKFEGVHVFRKCEYVLREDLFHSWPFAVPRWSKLNEETYGRSPSMKCLPDAKMLNAVMKTVIRGMQKVVDPPLMVPDNGFLLPIKTTPGGTNFYRTGMKDRIEAFPTGNARPDIGMEFVESIRARIRENFYYDQMQLIQQRDMTATEVMQRTDERLRFLGPVLGRLNNELLKPIIDRCFDILLRRGKFPAPPVELRDSRSIKIIYTSQIAKAQRTGESNTLAKVLQATTIIEAQPDIIDNLDGDAILRFNAGRFGLEHEFLRDPSAVKKIRSDRAEAQQRAFMAQQQNVEADTAQKRAKAQTGV